MYLELYYAKQFAWNKIFLKQCFQDGSQRICNPTKNPGNANAAVSETTP